MLLNQKTWEDKYPDYCRGCLGTGEIVISDPDPQIEGPCPICVERGLCPRCRNRNLQFNLSTSYTDCTRCGWTNFTKAEGMVHPSIS